jgi:hypothetical protein
VGYKVGRERGEANSDDRYCVIPLEAGVESRPPVEHA